MVFGRTHHITIVGRIRYAVLFLEPPCRAAATFLSMMKIRKASTGWFNAQHDHERAASLS
jgi:hypothetical protein